MFVGATSIADCLLHPNTGLVYIPTIEMAGVYNDKGIDLAKWQSPHFKIDPGVNFGAEDTPGDWSTAALLAWDPVNQKKVWEKELPPNWNPGTMTTKGRFNRKPKKRAQAAT